MAYKQAQNRKKKLLKTYHQIEGMRKHYTGSGVWYNDERGFFYKYTASNTPGYAKSLRKIGNKRVRKSKNLYNNSEYRRVFDYKWALF
jgi:protease II